MDAPLLPIPTCPRCGTEITLGRRGEVDCWSCPAGHGLAITLTEAYGRVQDDEIRKIFEGAKTSLKSEHACPFCGDPMVRVTIGVDVDEAAEGEAGDLGDTARLTVDFCRDDQFIWFDPGELDGFPQDIPEPEPTPEVQRKIDLVVETFRRELGEAYDAEENRGVLNRLVNRIVRDNPGFVRFLDKVVYRGKLDELTPERQQSPRAAS